MPPVRVVHAVTSSLTLILMRGQLEYLSTAGFEVTVLSAPGKELDGIRAAGHAHTIAVPMVREIAPLSDLKCLLQLYRVLRRLRPEIVNAGTPKAGLLVGLAAWLAAVPCRIHTLRGLRSETAHGLKAWVLRLTEKITCRAAQRVICNSPSVRERAIALGITDAHHSLVLGSGSSNGVDAARFAGSESLLRHAADIRAQLALPEDSPVIGFVGRLTRDKGIPELIEAFDTLRATFSTLHLLLIGNKEDGDPLPDKVSERLDRDARILCTGAVPDAAPYYPLMTIYALPTHREGFPNSVLEAQAAGLPVVTTSATGARDSIVDGVTGLLVPAGDGRALATALGALLADPARAKQFGVAGRERVRRDFQPPTIWQGLVTIYRDLLRQRGGREAAGATVSKR